MALPAGTKTTYIASSNSVDVNKFIVNVSPSDTPFYSAIGETVSLARFKENVGDTLTAANAANALVEGDEFTNDTLTSRPRTGNWCQIFSKVIQVSETQDVVDKYGGVTQEMPYQIKKAYKELGTDVEKAFIVGASASGTTASARKLDGLTALATTNTATAASATTWTATAAASVTAFEVALNDLFDLMYETGCNASTVYVGGDRKRRISGLVTNTTNTMNRNIDAQKRTMINVIDVYVSDFGQVDVILERYVPDTFVIAVNLEYFKTAYLRRFTQERLAKTGDSKRFSVVGELTLDCNTEKAIGVLKSA